MGNTKSKLQAGQPAFGAWVMIGHPSVAEIFAGEGFDWVCVDMEHTSTDIRVFHELALAVKGSACDLLVRLHSCDAVQAKQVLDAGANGIIVPLVNSREEAERSVAIAKFPPGGVRGAAFSRAADFGRNFGPYFSGHNERVLVAVMLEHCRAVENADAILSTPGVDAAFIGPYDLSASYGLAGQLGHPTVVDAQRRILDACKRHRVAAGIHVVALDGKQVRDRVAEGYRFIAMSLDTEMLIHACRRMRAEAGLP